MRRVPGRAVVLLVVGAATAQAEGTLTREQMAADLRQLAAEAASRWAYAELRRERDGIDLERLAADAVARLPDVHDDAAFAALLRELVASLRDGHAHVRWPRAETLPFHHWPFTAADTADGVVIADVLPAWNGAPVEVRRGDVLLAVDGTPLAELVAAAARTTCASTEPARRANALRAVAFGAADPRRYTVRRADGSEATVVAPAAAAHATRAARAASPAVDRPAAGVVRIRVATLAHRDPAAWARTDAAGRDALLAAERAALTAAFAQVQDARALVLDVRGNGGGTDLLGQHVAGCLLPADSVYYRLASRGWFGRWPSPSAHRLPANAAAKPFAGQLLVLIDEHVFSAADNLCRCLDDLHPDVTFVGSATGGGSGAPRPCITLAHSGAVVTLCTMRVAGPAGELVEGRGTVPDVPVRPTRAGVLAGRDEVLEAALARVRPLHRAR
jgi:carboxyl-terminal processing protease